GLRRGPIRRGRECDARLRMERELVALADRDELEVESGSFGLLQHARAFQEGEAWLTPEGEASKPADDLVVRAADQRLVRGCSWQPPPAGQRNRCRARPGQPAPCGRSPPRPGEGRASACCRAAPTASTLR